MKKGLPIFEWEHCAKSFQHIPNDLAMKHSGTPVFVSKNQNEKVKHLRASPKVSRKEKTTLLLRI